MDTWTVWIVFLPEKKFNIEQSGAEMNSDNMLFEVLDPVVSEAVPEFQVLGNDTTHLLVSLSWFVWVSITCCHKFLD